MKMKHPLVVLAIGSTLISPAVAQAGYSSPEVVLEWNEILQQTAAVGAGGPLQSRSYAMVHIAMFDAANSISRQYDPFRALFKASQGASPEAAAAQAARDVMTGLFGAQPAFDAALAARLASIPPGRAKQGVAIGKAVAKRVLAWRANDGAFAVGGTYAPPTPVPGQWQPTTAGANAALTQVPDAKPFFVRSVTQFLPMRHAEINSAAYAEDFVEVKDVGAVASASRSPEQTDLALRWAGVATYTTTNLFQIWNSVMHQTVLQQHLSLIEAARGFAVMNASMFDGILTSQTGKFVYGLWRPWDAIRRADTDLNTATDPDATWSPLLGTPPYPTYPGNMACLGAAAARSLRLTAGTDDAQFTVTWKGVAPYSDFVRHYQSYSELAQQEADSRIWGGIHFRFDNEASQDKCAKVADWVNGRAQPRH